MVLAKFSDVDREAARREPRRQLFVSACAACTMFAICCSQAFAVDGCLVLLCFAAPSWRAIPQCVPPIRQVLRDLARGRAFPTCGMAGRGNNASLSWASAPTNCPPQYSHFFQGEWAPVYTCDFTGAIAVNIEGQLWARTWWGMDGDSVTEFTDTAKRGLGNWDNRFDNDYAAWQAAPPPLPPIQPPCSDC